MSTITIVDQTGSLSITADLSQGQVTVTAPAQTDTLTVAAPGPTGPKGDTGDVSPTLQTLANQAAQYAQQAQTATSGYEKLAITANPQVLATVDAANAILELTGAGVNGQVVDLPAASRSMIVLNSTGVTVAVAMTGGTAQVSLQSGEAMPVYCDGLTGVYSAGAAIKRTTSAARYIVAPSWPTPVSTDNSTNGATTAFVVAAINALIAAAPGALNTLNELATALGDDPNFSTTMTNALAGKLALAGGTMTGQLLVSYASPQITLNAAAAAQQARLNFQTAGSERWALLKNSDAESGSNVGSSLSINRYDDTGTLIDTPFSMARATGLLTLKQRPIFGTNLAWDAGNFTPANYALLAGGNTFTGLQTITASGAPAFVVNETAGTGTPRYAYNSNGSNVWATLADLTANTWALIRYVSNSPVDRPISVANATGITTFTQRPVFGTATPWDTANFTPGNYAALAAANTFSAAQTISTGASVAALYLTANAGSYRYFRLQTGGVDRWAFGADNGAESGSNAGSSFYLSRFSDAGTLLDVPLAIARTTGIATLSQRPTWAGYTPWDSNNLTPGNYMPVTGGTFTGAINVTTGATAAVYYLNANAGQFRYVRFQTAGSARWDFGINTTAEAGSNAGSDLYLNTFTDAGVYLATPLTVTRSTGVVTFGAQPVLPATGIKFSDGTSLASANGAVFTGGAVSGATQFNSTTASTFAVRPTFNGATPWDSANFTPASYLPLTGGTLSGTLVQNIAGANSLLQITSSGASSVAGLRLQNAAYGVNEFWIDQGPGGNLNFSRYTYGTTTTVDTPMNISGATGFVTINSNLAVPYLSTSAFDASGAGQIRMTSGNYGVVFRNDGASFYVLSTASGSPTGSFNSLRPFAYNLASGLVTIDGSAAGTTFGGAVTTGSSITMNGGTLYTAPINYNDANGQSGAAIQVRNASGTGDAAVAAIAFLCQGQYGRLLHLRPDGYFGTGGWSAAAWQWYVDPSGNMVAAGNVTAYSDPRLKERFARIQKPMDILKALDGGTFYWREGFTHTAGKAGKRDYGVLADQVKAVMPEIVSESIDIEGQSYLTVAYEKLVPVLIEAFKSLDIKYARKVRALEKRLRELEKAQ